jgi:pimeloyl-ACP methyl ester carboxylesterase
MRITLLINNKKIICLKKTEHNPKYNTVIILTGLGTSSSNYSIFAKQFKKTEVIIINTPGHGFGKSLTQGEHLIDANELIDFQVSAIKCLIKEKYCTSKITLLGYSLGGMTLLNIINRKLLDENIDLCVLICSARLTRYDKDFAKALYNAETNTFNSKLLMKKSFTKKTPWYIKYINSKWIYALPSIVYADLLQGDSMNDISNNESMIENNKNVIAFIGEDDFCFGKDEMLNTIESFKNKTFISLKEYGHLFMIDRPIKAGRLVYKAIRQAQINDPL